MRKEKNQKVTFDHYKNLNFALSIVLGIDCPINLAIDCELF